MVQSSQNETHSGENPGTGAHGTTCRAQCKRRMQGPLFENQIEFQDGKIQSKKPRVGFFFFFLKSIYLFIFGCTGSQMWCAGSVVAGRAQPA